MSCEQHLLSLLFSNETSNQTVREREKKKITNQKESHAKLQSQDNQNKFYTNSDLEWSGGGVVKQYSYRYR